MSPAGPFITLSDAAFRLGETVVFKRTNWCFTRGQQWAVVGRNGAGKSVFAAALRGAFPLADGEIRYHFRPPPGGVHEDAIALVSFSQQQACRDDTYLQSRWNSLEQDGAQSVRAFLARDAVEERNPFEVVERPAGSAAAFARRQRAAVRQMRVAALLNRRLMTLSNGEMRKVLLARALLSRPRLLILDDPFAGLDAASRRHLRTLLTALMRTPTRLLLIATHVDELPRGITHLLVVDRCRVVAQGPLPRLFRNPSVRALLGAPRRAPRHPPPARAARGRTPAAAGEELVALRQVSLRYGGRWILRDIDWSVRRGESWALLGPNGSGKTALLSLIVGDNPQAYTQDVRVFGRRRGGGESIWSVKRRVGFVSPELHLHFEEAATALETALSGFHDTIGLFRRCSARHKETARRWLRRLGLAGAADRPLGALSTGQQRLALLARALVKGPALLVLDEPCQGLDAGHRQRFVEAVDAVIRRGETTVIFVTHRADEIPAGIARVLRLRDGRRV